MRRTSGVVAAAAYVEMRRAMLDTASQRLNAGTIPLRDLFRLAREDQWSDLGRAMRGRVPTVHFVSLAGGTVS